jgi:hypothetical protein
MRTLGQAHWYHRLTAQTLAPKSGNEIVCQTADLTPQALNSDSISPGASNSTSA